MSPSSESIFPEKKYKQLKIVLFALLLSLLNYGVVLWVMQRETEPKEVEEGLRMILSIMGLGACFIAMLVHQIMLAPKKLKHVKNKTQYIFVSFIITWALCEAGGVMGFVLAMLSQDVNDYIPFLAISSLAMLSHPPSTSRIKRALSSNDR